MNCIGIRLLLLQSASMFFKATIVATVSWNYNGWVQKIYLPSLTRNPSKGCKYAVGAKGKLQREASITPSVGAAYRNILQHPTGHTYTQQAKPIGRTEKNIQTIVSVMQDLRCSP